MSGIPLAMLQGLAVVLLTHGIVMEGQGPLRVFLLIISIAFLHATIGK